MAIRTYGTSTMWKSKMKKQQHYWKIAGRDINRYGSKDKEIQMKEHQNKGNTHGRTRRDNNNKNGIANNDANGMNIIYMEKQRDWKQM